MASWSHSHLLEFIKLYRSEECLWKIKSASYSNRLMKQRAYDRLLEFARTFDGDATKEFILRKINTIRSNFRKELRKVQATSLSGSGADEVHRPKLWYYNDMIFLQDQEQTRETSSSLERSGCLVQDTTLKQDTVEDGTSVTESSDDMSENLDFACSGTAHTTTSTPKPTPEPREARNDPRTGHSNIPWDRAGSKRKSEEDELLKIARQRLLSPTTKEDQFDAFGKLMAHKLRNLPYEQRVLAERLCHDVVLDAELGNLSRQTRVVYQPTCIRTPQVHFLDKLT